MKKDRIKCAVHSSLLRGVWDGGEWVELVLK